VTTKVRIDGVTIEATGEYEHELIDRVLDFLIARHSGSVVVPPTKEELEAARGDALKEADSKATAVEPRNIDQILEDFARRHSEADRTAEKTVGRPRQYPRVGVDGAIVEGPKSGATIAERLEATWAAFSGRTNEIADKAADGESVPEFWRTGIKTDEFGRKKYKTYYHCPACGDRGRHYLYEGTATCRCRACGAELSVSQAVPDAYLERDQYGNFFVAKTLAEPKQAENVEETVGV
jgi:transcription elongation factor Elf1